MEKIMGMAVRITDNNRKRIISEWDAILEKGWLMWGDHQETFKQRFAALSGRSYAETFNSETSALEIIFQYYYDLGLRKVAFQANGFPSPPMAALGVGMAAMWVDIDPFAMTPTLEHWQEAHDEALFDILVTQHNGGYIPSHMPALRDWCHSNEVILIEDAAHAAGSINNGRAGSFGDVAVFSLAATKALQTGQGGLLVTDDLDLAEYSFRGKNYGRDAMFQRGNYVQMGHNAHMTEMAAAMGNVVLDDLDFDISYRTQLAERIFYGVEDVTRLGDQAAAGILPNMYKLPIVFNDWEARGFKYDEMVAFFDERLIQLGSKIYDFVAPALPVYNTGHVNEDYPRTAAFVERHVCLPLHNAMTTEDADRVNEALIEVLA